MSSMQAILEPRALHHRATHAETYTSTYITIGIVTGLPVLILLSLAIWVCITGKRRRSLEPVHPRQLDIERANHLRAAKPEAQLPLHPALRPTPVEEQPEEHAEEVIRSSEDTKAATASEGNSLATQSSDEILAMKYGFSWVRA